jgi:hypothetical protein
VVGVIIEWLDNMHGVTMKTEMFTGSLSDHDVYLQQRGRTYVDIIHIRALINNSHNKTNKRTDVKIHKLQIKVHARPAH